MPNLLVTLSVVSCLCLKGFFFARSLSLWSLIITNGVLRKISAILQRWVSFSTRTCLKHSREIRKCLDDALPQALCFQIMFQRIWVRKKGKCVTLPLYPFLSPSLPSDIANSSERFFPQKEHRKQRFVTWHDSSKNKILYSSLGNAFAFFFFCDSKRMSL